MRVSGIKSDFTFKNSEHFIIIWRDKFGKFGIHFNKLVAIVTLDNLEK